MLLGDNGQAAVGGKQRARVKPLAQRHGELGLQRADVSSKAHSADCIEPVGLRMVQYGDVTADIGFGLHRHPEIGRRIRNAVAEEAGRRDADDSEGPGLDEDRRADDRRVAGVLTLPRLVAEHRCGSGGGLVVAICKDAARIRARTQSQKIIPGDKFAAQRLCQRIAAAYAPMPLASLYRSQLLELRRGTLEMLVKIIREDGKIAIGSGVARETAIHAAIVGVANAVELSWIGHRQRAQQDSVNQREDGRVGADAEGQREDHSERESRRLAQLAQRVTNILQ